VAKIRSLIVDDEPLARARIIELLAREPDVEIAGECANGIEAVAAIAAGTPDLVFLDVQMPELNGFGVLDRLGTGPIPVIVFVTAHDSYALKAFEVHALDYLLKPFDRDRFQRTLGRARDTIRSRADGQFDRKLSELLNQVGEGKRYLTRMIVKGDGASVLIQAREIDYFESAGNYVRIWIGRDRYLLRETMNALETALDPQQFARIHRSFIVNLDRVKGFEPYFHGDYVVRMHDGRSLTLSRTFRDRVETQLGHTL
jgi:two-component system, LytTR family, response regulator